MLLETIHQLIQLIDLTCLKDDATEADITALCNLANTTTDKVASVCIAPEWVPLAKSLLADRAIAVTTVVNFPKPTLDADSLTQAIKAAVTAGADEIDIVFPYDTFDPEQPQATSDWLKAARAACPNQVLKVILETGRQPNHHWIEAATQCVADSGANFVKTSTGKEFPGANIPAVQQIAYALRECDTPCGLKVSGGVRTVEQANAYCQTLASILGTSFLTPQWCRFGASSLLTDCINQLAS
jgi:deoxyribose-phosphate aldolase